MITTPIRATCAFAAVASFFLAIAAIVTRGEWALPFAFAALFALVAMFGGHAAAQREAERLVENFTRFRTAMRLCFSAALVLYSVAAAMRKSGSAVVQHAAILGVAFWLIAFVLAFFVAYFHAQLRTAQARE